MSAKGRGSQPADWAVILAGGSGTRLWPRTRHHRPKPLLSVGGRPLIQHTLDRLPEIPPERVVVVTGGQMADPIRAALPEVPPDQILVEPSPRHTAPAAAWGTWLAARRGAQRVVVLPSDQGVSQVEGFQRALRTALRGTEERIVLLGIPPTGPETGFGWIVGEAEGTLRAVKGFVEKPRKARAEALMKGGALWNAGIFCWSPARLRAALSDTLPGIASGLDALDAGAEIEAVWDRFEAESVDRGLLEPLAKTGVLAMVPARCGWSDLGTHPSLWAEEGQVGEVLALHGGGHRVHAPGKLVVTVGLEDLVIVDTDDALLICRRQDAQGLGEIVQALEPAGLGRFR